jgi:hypothetical protein
MSRPQAFLQQVQTSNKQLGLKSSRFRGHRSYHDNPLERWWYCTLKGLEFPFRQMRKGQKGTKLFKMVLLLKYTTKMG